MKIVATFEECRPVIVERFNGEMKLGERRADYLSFIESLALELPVASLLTTLTSNSAALKIYLDTIENDELGLFEEFFNVLCPELNTGTFEELPQWPIIRNALTRYHSTLEFDTSLGIELLNRSIRNRFNVTEDTELLLFELYDTVLTRLRNSNKEKLQIQLAQTIKDELTHNSIKKIQDTVEFILPTFEPDVIKKMSEKALAHADSNSDALVANIQIPKNCVWVQKREKSTKYVIEIPKSQFRVKFQDVPFEDVGHPRMLFVFTVLDSEQIVEMKLVCVKENTDINLDTPIYSYPYSNVFGNGRVCWGGYRDLKMPLNQVANIFLSTSNNSHLKGNVLDLFKANENKPFEDDMLEPFKEGNTLKDVL